MVNVNILLEKNNIFGVMHEIRKHFLGIIPYCIHRFFVLFYKHKEVIPMYR